jgi:non-homologous end joining protein Ku
VIKAKEKGKEVHVAAEPEEEGPADLLEALRASVESSKRRETPPRRRAGKTSKRKAA